MIRIDPLTAEARVVAHWDRRERGEQFVLVAGPGATVYVAASVGRSHSVAAIGPDGRVSGVVHGDGALTEAPPHASARGLTVVVTGPRAPRAVGYEWSRFAHSARGCSEEWP